MSRNGSGTYSLPAGNPVVTGTTISSTWANNTLSDIATALTQSIAKDGQTPITANIPFSGYKLTNVGAGTATGNAAIWDQLFDQGIEVALASAATTDLGAQTTNFVNVTGTTTITSFGTTYKGPRFVRFAGALLLTHNATTLVLPTGANITTAAGDTCVVVPKATAGVADGWVVESYQRASGYPLVTTIAPASVTGAMLVASLRTAMHGKCRLTKSGSDLLLSQYNGQTIVDGADNVLTIPSAGVTLAPTSSSPGTTYYIYAYDNNADGAVDTMEYSATGYTIATNGVAYKTGSTGRVLVGLARAITGPAWADTAAQRFVISYFNRRPIAGANAFPSNQNTTSASYAEISSSYRSEFLTWADETVQIGTGGWMNNSGASNSWASIGIDGTTPEDIVTATNSTTTGGIGITLNVSKTEGYHYATILGKTSAGTLTFYGGSSPDRCTINTVVQG